MAEEKYLSWSIKMPYTIFLEKSQQTLQHLWGLISARFPGNPYGNGETDEGLSEGDQKQLVQSCVVQIGVFSKEKISWTRL